MPATSTAAKRTATVNTPSPTPPPPGAKDAATTPTVAASNGDSINVEGVTNTIVTGGELDFDNLSRSNSPMADLVIAAMEAQEKNEKACTVVTITPEPGENEDVAANRFASGLRNAARKHASKSIEWKAIPRPQREKWGGTHAWRLVEPRKTRGRPAGS